MPPPPPPPRTKWTRRVPHPVLIGHAASLTSSKPNHLYAWPLESESHVRRGGLFLSRSMQAGARGRAGMLMPSSQDDALTAHEGGGKDAKTVRPKPFKKKWG